MCKRHNLGRIQQAELSFICFRPAIFSQILNCRINNLNQKQQMGGAISQGFCCCVSCCCRDIADTCKKLVSQEVITKINYIILVLCFVIPTILLFYLIHHWSFFLSNFSWLGCIASQNRSTDCVGPSTVYRISMSILVLFIIMALGSICRNKISVILNQGLFSVKYLLVCGIFVGSLFVNNQLFKAYALISEYISIGFMILQAIILIDLFFLCGVKLVKKYDSGQQTYGKILVILSIISEAVAITFNVLGYIYFRNTDQCGNSLWANIICSIILILFPIVQLFNLNQQNSLLTTSLVSVYVSYLTYISQYSYGGQTCKQASGRSTINSLILDVILSTFFFILTLYGSIEGGSAQANEDKQKQLKLNPSVKGQKSPEITQENELKPYQSWKWTKWHLYMSLASIYIGMLITNWTTADLISGRLEADNFGFWVRISISWLTSLLYIWTLIAPWVFPERDFQIE